MKNLVIISGESVFSGSARTGVGEMADSLAYSMGKNYNTSVVCIDGRGVLTKFPGNMRRRGEHIRICRVFSITYYLVAASKWPELGWEIVNSLNPDILHNLDCVDGYTRLSKRPKRMIYTFDRRETLESVDNLATHLKQYDAVRTGSKTYAQSLLAEESELGAILMTLDNFGGIVNGIATPIYAPEKGLLVTAKYSADNMAGKSTCKDKICKAYGIPKDKVIFLMMCQLGIEKGADSVLQCLHTIRDNGGFTILAGAASAELEPQLKALTHADGALWISERPNPLKAIPLLAGADFYLSPSVEEPGGLLPMQASRYGTVPIITQVDALADNFTADNALLIGDDGLRGAIESAFALYADTEALTAKRKACMEQDFSWDSRKAEYISLFEGSTNT